MRADVIALRAHERPAIENVDDVREAEPFPLKQCASALAVTVTFSNHVARLLRQQINVDGVLWRQIQDELVVGGGAEFVGLREIHAKEMPTKRLPKRRDALE